QETPPSDVFLALHNGSAEAAGTVTGPLDNLHFSGDVTATNGEIESHSFDHFSGTLDATNRQIQVTQLTLNKGQTEMSGSLTLTEPTEGFAKNFAGSVIAGRLNLRNAPVADLVKEAGSAADVSGTASANFQLAGTVNRIAADGTLDLVQPGGFGQKLDKLHADF